MMCQHNVFTSYDCPDCLKARIAELERYKTDANRSLNIMAITIDQMKEHALKQAERVSQLEKDNAQLGKNVQTWMEESFAWGRKSREDRAESHKLKTLILLTDPAVSSEVMNELSMKQWTEFERWKQSRQEANSECPSRSQDAGASSQERLPTVVGVQRLFRGSDLTTQQEDKSPWTAPNPLEKLHKGWSVDENSKPISEATVQGTKPSGGMRLGMNEYEHAKCKHEWRMAHPETGKCIHCTAAERTAQGGSEDG